MSWPATPAYTTLSKSQMDGIGDDPSLARSQLEAVTDRVNALSSALQDVIAEGNTGTLRAPGRLIGIQRLTGSGTYTETPGTLYIEVEMIGAGGGSGAIYGGSAGQYGVNGAGGSGAYCHFLAQSGFSGAAYSVGTGGAAGLAIGTPGGAGGDTSLSGFALARGGLGGASGFAGTTYDYTSSGGGGVLTWYSPAGATLLEGQSGFGEENSLRLGVGYMSVVAALYPTSRMGRIGAGGGALGWGNVATSWSGRDGIVGADGIIVIREYG